MLIALYIDEVCGASLANEYYKQTGHAISKSEANKLQMIDYSSATLRPKMKRFDRREDPDSSRTDKRLLVGILNSNKYAHIPHLRVLFNPGK